MNTSVRPCLQADVDTLRQIACEPYDETFRPMNTAETIERYLVEAFDGTKLLAELRNRACRFFLLYVDGDLAGYLKVNDAPAQSDINDPASMEVERIYVRKRHQGKGLAKTLMEHALKLAADMGKAHGWLGAWEKNVDAIAFYTRLGFQEAGRHAFRMGDELQTDLIMEKMIAGSHTHSPGRRSMGTMESSLTILETERLLLRYQQASDVEPLVALWADPDVTRHMGGPRDRAWLRSVFEETAQDPAAERYDLWPVVERQTGHLVGHCGLLDKEVEGREEIELTYILAAPAWGKGYATEIAQALKRYAFGELGITRLIALIEPENVASERVATKVGMRLEKEVIRPGGELRKVYAVEKEKIGT